MPAVQICPLILSHILFLDHYIMDINNISFSVSDAMTVILGNFEELQGIFVIALKFTSNLSEHEIILYAMQHQAPPSVILWEVQPPTKMSTNALLCR